MSKGHMIILGGQIESLELTMDLNLAATGTDIAKRVWTSVRRSPGGHRIATFLREQGYDVEVVDFWPTWSRIQLLKFFHQRVREDTLCVGLSGMFPIGALNSTSKDSSATNLYWDMIQTIVILKERYSHIPFIGGAQNLSAILDYGLDYYLHGFGENAAVEMLKYFKREFNTLKIEQKIVGGKTIKVIDCNKNYSAAPMADARVRYEDRDFIQPQEVLTIELARGCKFKCKFCQFPILGVKGDYSRSAESLREEMLDNYNRWGTTVYSVSDETVNDSPQKLSKCADVIRSLPFQPHLTGYLRADLLVNRPETWQDIWDMGLRSHYYGVESLHQPAGKIVGKGINVDKLKNGLIAVRDWFENKDEGRGQFRATISLILGLPEETRETFLDGIAWLQENLPTHSFNACPLYMSGSNLKENIQTPSVFDLTWEEEGYFTEMDISSVDPDSLEFHPNTDDWMREQLFKSGRFKWSHDTMNFVEALEVFDELVTNENSINIWPDVFFYHRYLTTNKYTIEDIYTKPFGDTEDTIQPFNESDLAEHMQFIQEYIQKKLAYGETA